MRHGIIAWLFIVTSSCWASKRQDFEDGKQTATIKLVGFSDKLTDSLTLYYYRSAFGFHSKAPIEKVKPPKSNGIYIIEFDPRLKFTYVTLKTLEENIGGRYILTDQIIEANDSIVISLKNGIVQYDGVGSAKFKALQEIESRESEWLTKYRDSTIKAKKNQQTGTKQTNLESYLKYPGDLEDAIGYSLSNVNFNTRILRNYQNQISSLAFDIIQTDLIGREEEKSNYAFRYFYGHTFKDISDTIKKGVQVELTKIYHSRNTYINGITAFAKRYSLGYANYASMFARKISENDNKGFVWIMSQSDLLLRDRLLLLYIVRNKRLFSEKQNITAALNAIQDGEIKEAAHSLIQSLTKGAKAFQFSLADTSGRQIFLSDLKNKVVVMDFWFTGCIGCRILAPKMDAVINQLKTDTNIVFLNISIDRALHTWKKSVSSHEYSSPLSLNLWTGGQGTSHELVKYYNIYAYPMLLIIGKNGNIFSANPPKPLDDVTKRQFIDLLKGALEE